MNNLPILLIVVVFTGLLCYLLLWKSYKNSFLVNNQASFRQRPSSRRFGKSSSFNDDSSCPDTNSANLSTSLALESMQQFFDNNNAEIMFKNLVKGRMIYLDHSADLMSAGSKYAKLIDNYPAFHLA